MGKPKRAEPQAVAERKTDSMTIEVTQIHVRFGDKLKEWRKTAGVSQSQLADALGVSRWNASQVERGVAAPFRPHLLPKLAELLNVPLVSLTFAAERDVVRRWAERKGVGHAEED